MFVAMCGSMCSLLCPVVTGASDGIGKAFCMEFARQGMDIVLISRTKSKLDTVAKDICMSLLLPLPTHCAVMYSAVADKYPVQTLVIAHDMSAGKDSGIYESIGEKLEDLDIGVLGRARFACVQSA